MIRSYLMMAVLFSLGVFPSIGSAQIYVGHLPSSLNSNPPGRILVGDTWMTPEEVAEANQQIEVLQRYRAIRDQAPDTLIGQTELARWCQENNLVHRRDAHLKRALVLDPENSRVRRFLRHVRISGKWVTPEQIETETNRMAAATRRMEQWHAPVKEIMRLIKSSSNNCRKLGWTRLDEIDDPNAITALEAILAGERPTIALDVLEVIDRFDVREASETLVRIAFGHSSAREVRDRAIELLSERNPYDFVPALLNQLVTPVSGRYSITPDRRGNVLYRYVLFQQDMEKDSVVQFDRTMSQSPIAPGPGLQRRMMRDADLRAAIATAGMEQLNRSIRNKNQAIQEMLNRTLETNPGDSVEDWWQWWYEENEVYTSVRPVDYTLIQDTEVTTVPIPTAGSGDCLVAGTPIWTDLGLVPVEELSVGDRVLCREPQSQRLEYQTVLQPTQRPPTPTFRISLDGETIQASGGHFFWIAGRGWTKTRDLQAGMEITTARGSSAAVRVQGIEPAETVELFNVVVDHNSNYFVGNSLILSHDSTIPDRRSGSINNSSE